MNKGNPASNADPISPSLSPLNQNDNRTVFLVQGRYQQVNLAVSEFLRSLDLRVLTWEQALALTGEPNPYIAKVIERGMAAATAVVVLFTAEDRVQLDSSLVPNATRIELEEGHQPRPNVLIEAGMALAYDVAFGTQKTLLVQFGDIRDATDLGGKHILRIGGAEPQWRHSLLKRLELAGLHVDDSDGNYLASGNFPTL
ncbi:MAG: TIR domain-containing protein [Actinomycetales bacterium]